jgi:triacylglycerol lipase
MPAMPGPIASLPMHFPPSFSLPDALACARLVTVAYDQCTQWVQQNYPRQGAFKWTPAATTVPYSFHGPLFRTHTVLGVTYDSPFGFVAQASNGDTFLALRGTMTIADDMEDAEVDQVPYAPVPGYGKVHTGFHRIYCALAPQIHGILSGLAGVRRLLFTGHSLGAGLSTLAVPDVTTHTQLKPGPALPVLHYNLASPRVGDPVFASMLNGGPVPTFRIVNTSDVVPDGPLPVLGSSVYQHVGTPVDFTAQYGTVADNHSLVDTYTYALEHPNAPMGPLPARALTVAGAPLHPSPLAALHLRA